MLGRRRRPPAVEAGALTLPDDEVDPGVLVVEHGETSLHARFGPHVADQSQPEPPDDHAGQFGQLGTSGVEPVQHGPRPWEQQFPGRGEANGSAGALEEEHAVLALQPSDLAAQC